MLDNVNQPFAGAPEKEPANGPDWCGFRVKNFKAWHTTEWLPLTRLSVVVDPHSAGKSSLRRPLLLWKQTLDAPNPQKIPIGNGPLIRDESPWAMARRHDLSQPLVFGMENGRSSTLRRLSELDPRRPEIHRQAALREREGLLKLHDLIIHQASKIY